LHACVSSCGILNLVPTRCIDRRKCAIADAAVARAVVLSHEFGFVVAWCRLCKGISMIKDGTFLRSASIFYWHVCSCRFAKTVSMDGYIKRIFESLDRQLMYSNFASLTPKRRQHTRSLHKASNVQPRSSSDCLYPVRAQRECHARHCVNHVTARYLLSLSPCPSAYPLAAHTSQLSFIT
jgi:hypothetical protein